MLNKKIIICGKSCAGKTYFRNQLEEIGYTPSISCTTRAPRDGEIDGVDYRFMSTEDFLVRLNSKEFIEYTCFNDVYYGTLKYDFNTCNLFIMTPDVIQSLNDRDSFFVVYLDAPIEVRLQRSINRQDNQEYIISRVLNDNDTFKHFIDYDIKLEISSLGSFDKLIQFLAPYDRT